MAVDGPRHQARERALALLYEAEAKHLSPTDVLAALPAPPDPFVGQLVGGVAGQLEDIDQLIDGAAIGWDLGRMASIDRAVLRLATYELLQAPEVPVAVVIDEAVELATQYSTDQSGRFVNGVLSAIAGRVRT